MKINVLSPKIYNRIAAGEVVERPASIVKELVENSLDAGANKIKIEIFDGGIKQIIVTDNGSGIEKDDLPLAFLPHATSKISDVDDLDSIATLGFRGEALASIASVSMVKLSTKTANCDNGYMIEANGGEISKVTEVARVNGTTISVSNLFYNTPARAKFLKKPKSEESEVTHLIEKFMLSRPDVNFEYFVDEKCVYNTTTNKLEDVIYLIYGREVYDNLLKVDYEDYDIKVSGFVVSPKYSRPNRTWQTLFVNGRFVENYMVSACIQGAYEPLLMKGRFPIYVLNLELPYDKVDVNVHPNKREVKFQENSRVFQVIRRAVERALISTNLIADFEFTNREEKDFSKFSIENDKEPQRTSFHAEQKTNIEPLSRDEGASYRAKIDHFDDESLNEPLKMKKKGIEIINMPEFSNIKSEDRKKNKPGGYIFFDQTEEKLISEVDLSAEPLREDKTKEKVEPLKETFLEGKVVDEIKIVGVIFKTYIITEYQDNIYIIDQHAMHERQLYDKLKIQVDNNEVLKQDLLVPYTFSLQSQDAEKFADKMENLHEIGFQVERDGLDFKISSIPFILSNLSLAKFVEEVLSDETIGDRKASAYINEKLCQTACKHAIRAGDSVTKDEIAYLIEEMKKGVLLCPHGRPIVVKITRKDFEKMFKRVL